MILKHIKLFFDYTDEKGRDIVFHALINVEGDTRWQQWGATRTTKKQLSENVYLIEAINKCVAEAIEN